ncbi:hypothetical protein [Aquimarina sp. SS2-1]|uniref:hypothetical protein n=1 Tax=Aquimarina besae TaxID=3342247 RepID=UPI00366E11BB
MKSFFLYLGFILVLIIVGFLVYPYFLDLSFVFLDKRDVEIFSSSISGRFSEHLYFATSLGAIPLLYVSTKYFTDLENLKQKILTYLLIIGGGILSWQLTIVLLNYRLKRLSEFNIQAGIDNTVSIESLDFDAFLPIGYAVGTIVSILIFRNRKTSLKD